MAYCTASDVIEYGGFTASDRVTTDTVSLFLTGLCSRAQEIVDGYCGRSFEYTATDGGTTRYFSYDEDVDASGVRLMLDKDLAAITSITVGSDTVTSSNYTTYPRSDKPYYAIRLKDNSTNSWDTYTSDGDWENAIQIKGEWVYSTAAPQDIKQATIRLALYMYKQRQTDADLDRPLLTNDGVTIMPTRLPADVMQILNRYKRTVIA
jgi:hypothetical protein